MHDLDDIEAVMRFPPDFLLFCIKKRRAKVKFNLSHMRWCDRKTRDRPKCSEVGFVAVWFCLDSGYAIFSW